MLVRWPLLWCVRGWGDMRSLHLDIQPLLNDPCSFKPWLSFNRLTQSLTQSLGPTNTQLIFPYLCVQCCAEAEEEEGFCKLIISFAWLSWTGEEQVDSLADWRHTRRQALDKLQSTTCLLRMSAYPAGTIMNSTSKIEMINNIKRLQQVFMDFKPVFAAVPRYCCIVWDNTLFIWL